MWIAIVVTFNTMTGEVARYDFPMPDHAACVEVLPKLMRTAPRALEVAFGTICIRDPYKQREPI